MPHVNVIEAFKQLSFDEKISAITGIESFWKNDHLRKGTTLSILDIVPDGIVGVNSKREIVSFNTQAEMLFGYKREEIIGKKLETIIPNRFHEAHEKDVAAYFNKPSSRRMGELQQELRGIKKNSQEFPVEISLSHVETGDEVIAFSAVRDVSEKKRLLKEFANTEAKLNDIASMLPICIIQAVYHDDGTLQFRYISEGIKSVYGITPEEAYADKNFPFSKIHPEDVEFVKKRTAASNSATSVLNIEFRIITPDGVIKWVYAEIHPKKEKGGETVRYGYIIDATETKQAEEQLKDTNNRYETLLKTTDEMMNTVSAEGKIIWANQAWKKNLLYTNEDIRGLKIINLLSNDTKYMFEGNFERLKAGETVTISAAKMVSKSGIEIDVEGTIVPIFENGVFAGSQSFLRNITRFKKERTERINAETRLQRTLDNMFSGYMVIGFDWTYLYVNEAAARQALQKPSNLVGKKMPEMYPGVESSTVFQAYKKCMDDRIHVEFEDKYTFPNGVTKWYDFHVEPIEEGIFVITNDITERKGVTENLLKNQKLLKDSQRIAKLGSWELNLVNNVLYWSDEIYRIFEIDPTQFGASYEAFLNLVHPEDKEYVDKAYRNAVENKTTYDIVHRLKFENGKVKYLREQAETFYDLDGKAINTVGTVHDITKEKEAEILLIRNEHKYQHVVENILDGLMIDDLSGRIVYANKKFMDMLGIREADLNDITMEDYVAPEFKTLIRNFHDRRVSGEEVANLYEFVGIHKDGTKKWFEAHVTTVTEDGSIRGTQSIIRDITDRKIADEERSKLIADITQRNKNLEQFSYMVSHNLRAPVANIIGITQFMKEAKYSEEDADLLLNGIYESVNKLDYVIKDLNGILQMRQAVNEMKENINFEELVTNIKMSIEHLVKKENVTIETDFVAVNEMFSIRSYFHSIFYNLIANSIKYRRKDADPIIEIKSYKTGNNIVLTFKDNGIGIDLENNKNDIFGMYKRFNFETEGKGLGLYMVKTQVESLGGTINVESELNAGTTFTIVFKMK